MTQPKTSPANKWLAPVLAITIAAAALLIFAPARNNDFLNWDDQSYVTQNDHVQGGLTVAGLAWAFTQSHSANWHPLTWMSHMLDVELSGLRPSGHHTTNLLLHAANAALLFLLLHRLTRSVWRSALVAAIFALHPLRVESVAWVAERKDVLSTFFGLLCLMAYGNYVSGIRYQVPGKHQLSPRSWYVATFLLLALGLMSKPMLVTWPFVMLLLDFWPLKRIEPSTFNIQHSTSSAQATDRRETPFLCIGGSFQCRNASRPKPRRRGGFVRAPASSASSGECGRALLGVSR